MIGIINKKSIAAAALVLTLTFAVGCTNTPNRAEANTNSTSSSIVAEKSASSNKNDSKDTNKVEASSSTQTTNQNNSGTVQTKQATSNDSLKDTLNVAEKVKNYIVNGQESKPEAQKLKWSKTFLNRVDIDSLYKQYIANGGKADDTESFASYMNQCAPIPSDWQELFKKDLEDAYGEKVVKLEHLQGDLYQAYVVKDGSQVPFVVVSSRTGYFHG